MSYSRLLISCCFAFLTAFGLSACGGGKGRPIGDFCEAPSQCASDLCLNNRCADPAHPHEEDGNDTDAHGHDSQGEEDSSKNDAGTEPGSQDAHGEEDSGDEEAPEDSASGDLDAGEDTAESGDSLEGQETVSSHCDDASDCGFCDFPNFIESPEDCVCPPSCPVSNLSQSECAANTASYQEHCGQTICTREGCASTLPAPICNENSRCEEAPNPYAPCETDDDCTLCATHSIPNNPEGCYCIECDRQAMTQAQCQYHRDNWDNQCEELWYTGSENCNRSVICMYEPPPLCLGGQCLRNINSCETDEDCSLCPYKEIPSDPSECVCPGVGDCNNADDYALSKNACDAIKNAVNEICADFVYDNCQATSLCKGTMNCDANQCSFELRILQTPTPL